MDVGDQDAIITKVGQLNDIELAILLCLVNGEHCIIKAEQDQLEEVEAQVEKSCCRVFDLSVAKVRCSSETTLDHFVNHILLNKHIDEDIKSRPGAFAPIDRSGIAQVIISSNLHLANKQVQIQALELIRGKRIFTRTEVHVVPRQFLFVTVLPNDPHSRLIPLLNDQIFLSHSFFDETLDDDLSERSVDLRRQAKADNFDSPVTIAVDEIDILSKATSAVKLSAEIRAYLHNIIVFLRLHRAVAGGITCQATKHFLDLAHALAALHGCSFITPSFVALAARKVYPHRLAVILPEGDRSLQWGSSIEAVEDFLEGMTTEDVIEDVLRTVQTPL